MRASKNETRASNNETKALLFNAIKESNYEQVRNLLEGGVDVNLTFGGKQLQLVTPLHYVCRFLDIQMIKLLLEYKANPNLKDCNGKVSLHYAIINGDIEAIELLLNNGADPNLPCNSKTIIHSKGTEFLRPEGLKRTPLHYAIISGDIKTVELLLNNGADLNLPDNNKISPLHFAVKGNNKDIVALLLIKGASPNVRCNDKIILYSNKKEFSRDISMETTPLHIALKENNKALVELLLNNGADPNWGNRKGESPLCIAASNNDKALVELLLNKGADPNGQNRKEETPLHIALKENNKALVELLLNNGADPNGGDRDLDLLYPPLCIAVGNNDQDLVELLLSKGADPNPYSVSMTMTPLQLAVDNNNKDLVELFLNKGADPNESSDRGAHQPPLHFAISNGNKEIMELLLEYGADPDLIYDNCYSDYYDDWYNDYDDYYYDSDNDNHNHNHNNHDDDHKYNYTTLLHSAACNGNKEAVELLLKYGANPNVQNKKGETPLHSVIPDLLKPLNKEASHNIQDSDDEIIHFKGRPYILINRIGIAELLLNEGANPNVQNKKGETPLHIVVGEEEENIKFLLEKNADPNLKDKKGNVPLHYAVDAKSNEHVELLLKYGANPNKLRFMPDDLQLKELLNRPSPNMFSLFPDAKSCIHIEFKIESLIKTLGILPLINTITFAFPIETKCLIGSYCINTSFETCAKIADEYQKLKPEIISFEDKIKQIYKILETSVQEEQIVGPSVKSVGRYVRW
ncbi:MAG: serine/threonine-protein phosphatase 6 regulatory ankyrin repeat subunit B-like [Candidatus Midichloriaceae bacterium]|jgi:ankyrin repeat protein|nr:serine/threonine-protein phosphatase 6 regulatory ankyrin repeat subunit B-like [Candidatus Midichloriaceae bacterium]